MKTKTLIVAVSVLFLISGITKASVVDTTTAKNTARNFIFKKINKNDKVVYENIELKYLKTENLNNEPAFYIYNLKNQTGFVIISAESETTPILGYSYEVNYDINQEIAPAFEGWMNHYKEQIEYIRKNDIKATKKITDTWVKYSSVPDISTKSNEKDIAPLLTTTWNQGTYYNELCPADAGGQNGHVWVGCVATAMAQVIKFWNYPDYGSGQNTYNDFIYGTQTADFENTYYDWASMPNSLSTYNTPVATLSYHCGVAVNMSYGTNGSSSNTGEAATGLKRFFDYSHNLYVGVKNNFVDTAWRDLIKSELDLGHPLFYSGYPSSGSGHAFNCDGYQGTDYFHFNWGWGGSYNGYFYLDDLTPGSQDYTYSQAALINCYPDCLSPQCGGSVTTLTDASGTLTDGSPISGYYTNYSNCSNCEYLIQPTGATSVYIDFESFSTIEGEDSLYVYDGADASAPLLYALSGDTIPDNFFSSTGSVYFHFVSDNFRTAPGWEISYTIAFDDVGITYQYLPQTKTCGKLLDTIQVLVKNFGANTQTNIPVVVDVITPSGPVTINGILPGPIARNEWQYFDIGTINTTELGTYSYTAYTNLASDNVINSNDTSYYEAYTKTILSVPHAEIFDDLHGEQGDWYDRNWAASPDIDVNGTDTNYIMRAWIDEMMYMFLLYDRKVDNITANTNMRFDYRFLNSGQWPPTDSIAINSNEMIHIVVSTDCGVTFDTIFTIDTLNHVNTSEFATKEVSLAAYAGQEIIVGFVSDWDSNMAIVDIDNVILLDNITGNIIEDNQIVCETNTPNTITGSTTTGGIGTYTYLWQESSDNITWTDANGTNNAETYTPAMPSDSMLYRRIVSDTLAYADTSNVVTVKKVLNPVINITGSLETCEGYGVYLCIDTIPPMSTYIWSNGDTSNCTYFYSSGTVSVSLTDANACSGTSSANVVIHNNPVVDLGNDTTIFANQNIVLYAGSGYTNYTWSTPTGCFSNTSPTYTADSTNVGFGTGNYCVTVIDNNGCGVSDCINITYAITNDIFGEDIDFIKIYPNPTKGLFSIEAKDIKQVVIYDITGKLISDDKILKDYYEFDLANNPKGVYFVKIITENATVINKIVKN